MEYPQIQFMASGSIMALSINVVAKRDMFLLGGCDILTHLSEFGLNTEIQKNAKVSISNVSENISKSLLIRIDARSLLCEQLVHNPEIFMEVFDLRCIKELNNLILKIGELSVQGIKSSYNN